MMSRDVSVYEVLTNRQRRVTPKVPVVLIRSSDKRRRLPWEHAYVPGEEDHVPVDGYDEAGQRRETDVVHVPVLTKHLRLVLARALKPKALVMSTLVHHETSRTNEGDYGDIVSVHPAEAFALVRMGLLQVDSFEPDDGDALGGYWTFSAPGQALA